MVNSFSAAISCRLFGQNSGQWIVAKMIVLKRQAVPLKGGADPLIYCMIFFPLSLVILSNTIFTQLLRN